MPKIHYIKDFGINLDKFNISYRDDKGVFVLVMDSGNIEISQRDGADAIEAFLKSQDSSLIKALNEQAAHKAQHEVQEQPQQSRSQAIPPLPLEADFGMDLHGTTVPLVQANISKRPGAYVPAIIPQQGIQ